MNKQNQNHGESVTYRIALRMFESAFAACDRLPEADQQFLLREIGKRILKNISQVSAETAKSVQVLGVEIKQQSFEDSGSGDN